MMTTRHLLALLAVAALAAAPPTAAASAAAPQSAQSHQEVGAAASRSQAQPAVPTITFRKIFKSSTPEFVEIKVDERGAASSDIRQLDEDPSPEPFHIAPALAAKIFSLAAGLHDFNGIRLEAKRRIANLGEKTFRYDNGPETYQVSFNYTLNQAANDLLEIFEGLSLQQQYVDELNRSMRYDPLGLNDVLLRLQGDLAHNLLADPAALLPVLNRISSDQRFLNIARQRARLIASGIGSSH
jgi:hypothetical protein